MIEPSKTPMMLTSQRNDPHHWNADLRETHSRAMSEANAARINAAQAKRDRKNAKRLRDAMREGKG